MKFLHLIFLFFVSAISIYSQSGMTFGEFALKLDPYFDRTLIEDIRDKLPQKQPYTIWGWDVGDYSGDGYNDVAFSLRYTGDRSREMHVHLFIDIDGFLNKVAVFNHQFVEIPLEIGVVIRNNACYITKKNKQFDWNITGYRFDHGSLIMLDEYHTSRIGKLTQERYINYNSLYNTEKYLNTKNGEQIFYAEYLVIPSYPRGKKIYKGYNADAFSEKVEYVRKGAYYWEGDEDCSFRVKSAYDDQFIYLTVEITDNNIVIPNCDTCQADHIQLWFDVNDYPELYDRFHSREQNDIVFRTGAEEGIYKISVYPGDFLEKKAYVTVSSTDELYEWQREASNMIKAVSNLTDDGYIIKFKIPFYLFGFEGIEFEKEEPFEIGCTVAVYDIDNEYRPEESSIVSTSIFSEFNPSSYGSLVFIPPGQWYGSSKNIYKDDLLQVLNSYGF